jgi:hypothetical protein
MTMGLGVQPGLAPRALGGLFTGELPVEGEIGDIAVAARVHIAEGLEIGAELTAGFEVVLLSWKPN